MTVSTNPAHSRTWRKPTTSLHKILTLNGLINCVALTIIAIATVMFLVRTTGWALDDSYITYRYAKHLELGYGPVFNVGERYLGTTAPGFAVLLALTHRLIAFLHVADFFAVISGQAQERIETLLDIPHLGRYFSALSLGTIALTTYAFVIRSFKNSYARIIGIIGAVWIVTLPPLASVTGHETLTCVALLLLGLYFWQTRLSLGAFLIGCATVVRPDAALAFVLVASLAGLNWLIRRQWQALWHGIRSFLAFLPPVLLWYLFAWFYYGSPIPGTLVAKRALVSLGIWRTLSFEIMEDAVSNSITPAFRVFILCAALIGIAAAILYRDSVILVGLWGLAYLLAYSALHVVYTGWYVTPLYVAYAVMVVYGSAALPSLVEQIIRRFAAKNKPEQGFNGLAILVVLPFFFLSFGVLFKTIEPNWRAFTGPKPIHLHTYSFQAVSDYIQKQSPTGAVIATPEPGALAYFLGPNYRVVDTLGLTAPGVSEHILMGDLEWPYLHSQPDYVLVSYEGNIQPNLNKPWFRTSYILDTTFDHPYWSKEGIQLRLYRRDLQAKIDLTQVPANSGPEFKQLGPGEQLSVPLTLESTKPRVLRVTFFDLEGRDIDVAVDDKPLFSIKAGASGGAWRPLDIPLPQSTSKTISVTVSNPGKEISALTMLELREADAGAPAQITFTDIKGNGDWPSYAQIAPGESRTEKLGLWATGARVLSFSYLDLAERDLSIAIDGRIIRTLSSTSTAGTWQTVEIPIPDGTGDRFTLEIGNPGRNISAFSEVEVIYANVAR